MVGWTVGRLPEAGAGPGSKTKYSAPLISVVEASCPLNLTQSRLTLEILPPLVSCVAARRRPPATTSSPAPRTPRSDSSPSPLPTRGLPSPSFLLPLQSHTHSPLFMTRAMGDCETVIHSLGRSISAWPVKPSLLLFRRLAHWAAKRAAPVESPPRHSHSALAQSLFESGSSTKLSPRALQKNAENAAKQRDSVPPSLSLPTGPQPLTSQTMNGTSPTQHHLHSTPELNQSTPISIPQLDLPPPRRL